MSGKGAFKIIRLDTGDELKDPVTNETRIFGDGDEATRIAKLLTEEGNVKYQPRRIGGDTKWKEREAGRFLNGTYTKVPWEKYSWWKDAEIKDHFLHVSTKGDTRLAYTPDEVHGLQDRQVPIKPGVYLQKYYHRDFNSDTIRQLVSEFSVEYDNLKYQLATSSFDIEDVYLNGPGSCMTHQIDRYQADGRHPAVAYAGGDLAVAYLPNPDPTGEDVSKYTARAVVWPEKKIYRRIYGDKWRLEALLRKDGYKEGSFVGAKLRQIPLKEEVETEYGPDKGFVCPYIDGYNRLREDGKFFVIDESGPFPAQLTIGHTFDSRPKCVECKTRTEGHPKYLRIHQGRLMQQVLVCEKCLPMAARVDCRHTGRKIRKSDSVSHKGNDHFTYHKDYADQYFVTCSKTGDRLLRGYDAIHLKDGSWVSKAWYDKHGRTCFHCMENTTAEIAKRCRSPSCQVKSYFKDKAMEPKLKLEEAVE